VKRTLHPDAGRLVASTPLKGRTASCVDFHAFQEDGMNRKKGILLILGWAALGGFGQAVRGQEPPAAQPKEYRIECTITKVQADCHEKRQTAPRLIVEEGVPAEIKMGVVKTLSGSADPVHIGQCLRAQVDGHRDGKLRVDVTLQTTALAERPGESPRVTSHSVRAIEYVKAGQAITLVQKGSHGEIKRRVQVTVRKMPGDDRPIRAPAASMAWPVLMAETTWGYASPAVAVPVPPPTAVFAPPAIDSHFAVFPHPCPVPPPVAPGVGGLPPPPPAPPAAPTSYVRNPDGAYGPTPIGYAPAPPSPTVPAERGPVVPVPPPPMMGSVGMPTSWAIPAPQIHEAPLAPDASTIERKLDRILDRLQMIEKRLHEMDKTRTSTSQSAAPCQCPSHVKSEASRPNDSGLPFGAWIQFCK
jgi:hypothetical protein